MFIGAQLQGRSQVYVIQNATVKRVIIFRCVDQTEKHIIHRVMLGVLQ